MRYKLSGRQLGLIALIVVLVVLAFVSPLYYLDVFTVIFINALLVVSFRFIALSGELSFAHVAMMAVGAYTTGLLTTELGWPFWASLPAAGVAAGLVAYILSYPLLRMKGFYFFIGSFAAGEALRLTFKRFKFFGGAYGVEGIPKPTLPGVDFSDLIAYYLLVLAITVLCLVIMYRLERSRMGDTIKAVSAQDSVAQSVGINVRHYKSMAFVIGSAFAGVAGALFAHRLGGIDAEQFTFALNLLVVVWAVFGGLGVYAGPLVGLAILSGIDEAGKQIGNLQQWTPFIYGFILIIILLLLPKGVMSLPERIRKRRLRGEAEASQAG